MGKALNVIAVFAVTCWGAGAASGEEQVSASVVRTIEHQVVMPPQSEPLVEFDRYYSHDNLRGRPIVMGIFIRRSENSRVRPEAVPIPSIPNAYVVPKGTTSGVSDGGCSVIMINFDLETQSMMEIEIMDSDREPLPYLCNGR